MRDREAARPDVLTIASISVTTLLLESVLHHLLGHGAAFVVMGASLRQLTTLLVSAEAAGLAPWQLKLMLAAGSGADIIMALLCLALLRARIPMRPQARYFLWLTMATGFFLPGSYLAFCWLPFLDWYAVTAGLWPEPAWRMLLAAIGAMMYAAAMGLAARELEPFLGADPNKQRSDARLLARVPYVTMGTVNTLAPLMARAEPVFIILGLFAFVGLAGLCFVDKKLRKPVVERTAEALPLNRDLTWIAIGAVALIIFLGVLGPGIEIG